MIFVRCNHPMRIILYHYFSQIGMQDEDQDGQSSLVGDVIAFFAAAFYGLYTTVLRYQVLDRTAKITTICLMKIHNDCSESR